MSVKSVYGRGEKMAGIRKKSKGAYAGLILIYICMFIVILITLYPFVYVFSMSVSDPMSVLKQEVWFLIWIPIKWYVRMMNYGYITEIPYGIR